MHKSITIEAGEAFGSGAHPSTAGALLALSRLQEQGFVCSNVLDIGCGSGVLSVAAASLWPCNVIACDMEAAAVAMTLENAAKNGLEITCVRASGFAHPEILKRAPFDLILCNILPDPLLALAHDLARHLRGAAVLSGILAWRAAEIEAAYGALGLELMGKMDIGEWRTFVFSSSSDKKL